MSEEHPASNPSDESIPPVEPIVADDGTDDAENLAAESTPTEGTPTAATAADVTTPTATAASPEPARATPDGHVMLPKWVVFTVVGVALAALGFGVGWIAKPDSESSRPAAATAPFRGGNPFGENGPFGDNGGRGNEGGRNGGVRVTGAYLGVSATATSGDVTGAEVARVVGDSPADDAGFQEGDVITKVDDTEISTPAELVQVITAKDSGDEVTVTFTRDGEAKTADVTLGDRADAPSQLRGPRQGTED